MPRQALDLLQSETRSLLGTMLCLGKPGEGLLTYLTKLPRYTKLTPISCYA